MCSARSPGPRLAQTRIRRRLGRGQCPCGGHELQGNWLEREAGRKVSVCPPPARRRVPVPGTAHSGRRPRDSRASGRATGRSPRPLASAPRDRWTLPVRPKGEKGPALWGSHASSRPVGREPGTLRWQRTEGCSPPGPAVLTSLRGLGSWNPSRGAKGRPGCSLAAPPRAAGRASRGLVPPTWAPCRARALCSSHPTRGRPVLPHWTQSHPVDAVRTSSPFYRLGAAVRELNGASQGLPARAAGLGLEVVTPKRPPASVDRSLRG